jgi:carbamoyl-phosphate synthase large subunit
MYAAFHQGAAVDDLARATGIDPYFLRHLQRIVALAHEVQRRGTLRAIDPSFFYDCKESGLADAEIAALVSATEQHVREAREAFHLRPRFRAVDTCAGEFAAQTPYFYSAYDHPTGALPVHEGDEDGAVHAPNRGTVIVLGSGPIRIGQGVEFDYACVHAVGALRKAGYRAVMVNSNPETVSTDFDVADRLYFEPLTLENVLAIVQREKPLGVFVQFGGQAPLKLAKELSDLGVHILGTSPDSIDLAEDRERFGAIVRELGLKQPEGAMVRTVEEALVVAGRLGYPVLVRPSYVLGGRAMRIVHDVTELRRYAQEAVDVSPDHPLLVDKFLHHATEVDVDVVADRKGNVIVGGFLEHVEEAGVHSGDAACIIPPVTLSSGVQERMRDAATALARRLGVIGLLNVQFAVIGKTPYVLEANPRASRTVPFVAKATGLPLARWAARAMMGETLEEMGAHERETGFGYAVKESVFPFFRFANADVLLGPEMKSTGEVMGAAPTAAEAFAKAALAAGANLTVGDASKPSSHRRALLFVSHHEKPDLVAIARRLAAMGLTLTADEETAAYLGSRSLAVEIAPSDEKSLLESLEAGEVALLVATRKGVTALRRAALAHGIPYATTLEGAHMYAEALAVRRLSAFRVQSLQERGGAA